MKRVFYEIETIGSGEDMPKLPPKKLHDFEFSVLYPNVAEIMKTKGISQVLVEKEDGYTTIYTKNEIAMPSCDRCKEHSIVEISMTNPVINWKHADRKWTGHNLRGMGFGDYRNYFEIRACISCGKIQGEFPRPMHGVLVTRETSRRVLEKTKIRKGIL